MRLPILICISAPLLAQPSPVTRGDLAPVYRATDQAYAAALPPAGPERAAINRAFDRATLRFFGGDLGSATRAIADVRQMLVGARLDTTARSMPLQRFVVRAARFAYVIDSTPRRRPDSLEFAVRPLAAAPDRTDTIMVRFEIAPAQRVASDSWWSTLVRVPMSGMQPTTIRIPSTALRDLKPGRFVPRLVRDGLPPDTSLFEEFAVVAGNLDSLRRAFEADLAALTPPSDSLAWTRALFSERISLLTSRPGDEETTLRSSTPHELARELRGELVALRAQRTPYRNRAGDHWWRLSTTVDGSLRQLPVRVIAPTRAAQSAVPVPLVIALHGAGMDENGFAVGYGNGRLVKEAADRGMLVATPSTVALQRTPALLDTLIATLRRSYRVDPTRIYVIGHSMGAGLLSALVQRSGHPFAAGVAIAGGGAIAKGDGVPPIRFVGAALDPIIPAARVQQAATAAIAAGVKAEYVEVPDVGHTMVVTHVLGETLDWLLRHRR
jgi:dienelactone hydrolase